MSGSKIKSILHTDKQLKKKITCKLISEHHQLPLSIISQLRFIHVLLQKTKIGPSPIENARLSPQLMKITTDYPLIVITVLAQGETLPSHCSYMAKIFASLVRKMYWKRHQKRVWHPMQTWCVTLGHISPAGQHNQGNNTTPLNRIGTKQNISMTARYLNTVMEANKKSALDG